MYSCAEISLHLCISNVIDSYWVAIVVAIDVIIVVMGIVAVEWGPVMYSSRVSTISVYFTHYLHL
jgi:hypothetical protein